MTQTPSTFLAIGGLTAVLVAALVLRPVATEAAGGHQERKEGNKVDVTGAWQFEVATSAGSGSPSFVFKQEGEKLTGRYHGLFGEAELIGTVKGSAIEFSFQADAQGQSVQIVYRGTVDGDSMRGTVAIGDLADGTFTGRRK